MLQWVLRNDFVCLVCCLSLVFNPQILRMLIRYFIDTNDSLFTWIRKKIAISCNNLTFSSRLPVFHSNHTADRAQCSADNRVIQFLKEASDCAHNVGNIHQVAPRSSEVPPPPLPSQPQPARGNMNSQPRGPHFKCYSRNESGRKNVVKGRQVRRGTSLRNLHRRGRRRERVVGGEVMTQAPTSTRRLPFSRCSVRCPLPRGFRAGRKAGRFPKHTRM